MVLPKHALSNHGLEVNAYKQYLSSPYTRVEGLK